MTDASLPCELDQLSISNDPPVQDDQDSVDKHAVEGAKDDKACDESLKSPTVRIIQHGLSAMVGVTVVDKEIFIVARMTRLVKVYDSQSLNPLREFTLQDQACPEGVAGCAYNKALYISDTWINSVRRIDLTNDSETRWGCGFPKGLSVTTEHTVLVTIWIGDTGGASSVLEFTTNGQLLRTVAFETGIFGVNLAYQTLKFPNDQLITCHGSGRALLHRVCIINTEGKVVKSYGREKGSGEGQLNCPTSIALDNTSEKHIVFVADYANNRVVLLDTDLNYLGLLSEPRDISGPFVLFFESSTNRLLVGEYYSGRLLVISDPV